MLAWLILFTSSITLKSHRVNANEFVPSSELQSKLEQVSAMADIAVVEQQMLELIALFEQDSNAVEQIYRAWVMTLFQRGELEKAAQTAILGRQYGERKQTLETVAKFHKLTGVIYYYQGNYSQALSQYQAAIDYYIEADKPIELAHLYNNMGLVLDAKGEPTLALSIFKKAKVLYDQVGTEDDQLDINFNISGLYLSLNRYDKALQILPSIINTREQRGNLYDAAQAYVYISLAHKQAGNYQQAEQYSYKALRYYQDNNKEYDVIGQYNNLAELYSVMGAYEKAADYAHKCLVNAEKNNYSKMYSNCSYINAQIQYQRGNIDMALKHVNDSLELSQQREDQMLVLDNQRLLSLILAAKGEFKQAMAWYRQSDADYTELSNRQLSQQLDQFESEQLAQQLKLTQKQRQLDSETHQKKQQMSDFVFVITIMLALLVFLIYRKYKDQRYNQNLAKQVHQRTQQFELASAKLAKANRIKSQFLANMSHEIRTPLTAIIGLSEAIVHGEFKAQDVAKEVDVIHANSKHLLLLVNDILDLSKMEENKLSLSPSLNDISLLSNDLANLFGEQAKQKGVDFVIDNQLPQPCSVYVDHLRIRQIIINLCANAIKFTEQGSVLVTLGVEHEQLVVTVKDTGIGMDESQLSSIFDSFAQADASIHQRFGGSGLGLHLSSQLAKLMSAKISVTSTLNKGSCFSFSMPVQRIFNDQLSVKQLPANALSSTKLTGRVLLADDNTTNRRYIAQLLTGLGIEVLLASDGLEVLDTVIGSHRATSDHTEDHSAIDMILLDIQMPRLDGIETFKQLRAAGYKKPIIAVTANAMTHEVQGYLELGFNAHIQKPIEREHFVATLARYLSERSDSQTKSNKQESSANRCIAADMTDLIEQFEQSLPHVEQQVIDFHQRQNWSKLQAVVHQIAGSASLFGYSTLSELAIRLDEKLRQYLASDDAILTTPDDVGLVNHNNASTTLNIAQRCVLDEISGLTKQLRVQLKTRNMAS